MNASEIHKKTLTAVLTLAFIFSPVFTVQAQIPVTDAAHITVTSAQFASEATKEYSLDFIAWFLANLALERIGQSTVNWINSGFQGKPTYVTDTSGFFLSVADQAAGQYIQNNTNFDFLCGPIQSKIRIALQTSYSGRGQEQWQCSLTDIYGNMEDFMGDFSSGGWNKFFRLTQERQNNPIGVYIQAENELYTQIAESLDKEKTELNWGQGFFSMKDANGQITTPGKAIEGQLNNVLGSGTGKLAAADEIDEIISALLNQLIMRVVGGAGGLRGS